MWTPATRKNYSRNGLRYQSDVTDEEWRVIEPYLPPAKGIGRPRGWPLREIVNGIFYVMRSGCPWRQLPKDLPPWSTVYRIVAFIIWKAAKVMSVSKLGRPWFCSEKQAEADDFRLAFTCNQMLGVVETPLFRKRCLYGPRP